MPKQYYETQRLLLVPSAPALSVKVLHFYKRNATFFKELDPPRNAAFYTKAAQRHTLAQDARNAKQKTALRLWLLPKSQGAAGPIVGMVGLGNVVYGPFCSAFLSYKIDEGWARQGLMAEAVGQMAAIAFGEWGLHRLEANIMPRNTSSLRLAEKLGFHSEGLAKQYLNINGTWEDHVHMVLLNRAMEQAGEGL